MRAYGLRVSVRKLFGILFALAVLLAPPAIAAGHMSAMPDRGMPMMQMGHCDVPPSNSASHDKNAGKNCCISMCMAVGVTPEAPKSDVDVAHPTTYFPVATSWHGHLGEIATPPPRTA
jgi:hypothetical protein